MNQRKLSGVLMLAGGIAALGLIFLFYIYAIYLLLFWHQRAVNALAHMVMGVPYMIAMWHYFRICQNIGGERSFCMENARRLNSIAGLLFLAAGLWAAALVLVLTGNIGPIAGYTVLILVEVALALMATFAVALVAKVMSLMVDHASRLQEENDLTI